MKGQDKRQREGSLRREQLKERRSRSVIRVTDSVTGGKMMKKKKGAQTDRGSAGCCQMKTATASNQPITVRLGRKTSVLSCPPAYDNVLLLFSPHHCSALASLPLSSSSS